MFTVSLTAPISVDFLISTIAPKLVAGGFAFSEDTLSVTNSETGKAIALFEVSGASEDLDSIFSELGALEELQNLFTGLDVNLEFGDVLYYDSGASLEDNYVEVDHSDAELEVEPIAAPMAGSWAARVAPMASESAVAGVSAPLPGPGTWEARVASRPSSPAESEKSVAGL